MRHITLVFSSLVALSSLFSTSQASVLPDFKAVTVKPGELLEHLIPVDRSKGFRIEIKLLSPPEGAGITLNDDGQLMLQWKTGTALPAETGLVIQARNLDTQVVVETGVLQVQNVLDVAETELPPQSTTVTLDPMPNQIVSSGQAVSIPLTANSSDDKAPLISIDRVPPNASFEKSLIGGYTFFWQTGGSDEGEHIFRVTAVHPSEESISASALLTVFVGDPSISTTRPAPKENNGG
ncbi:MAG: hypothetical protein AB8B97_09150 [Granulosicoccus sp.]